MSLSIGNSPLSDPYKRLETAFSEKKSYYIIEEDVNLKGRTIKFPKDAVIDFRGGRIKNGTVRCNNNTIMGYAGLAEDVSLDGSILGPLDLSVFVIRRDDKKYDFGPILNKAAEICKSIVVPEGVFYFKTPIVLENIKNYQQLGDLIYNGKSKDVTAIRFINAFSSVVSINGKVIYDTDSNVIDYSRDKRTNIIGIEFANFNNCTVFVNDVEYFNNNIRISGYGAGNCYNKYTINTSVFSNEHLRVFQKDFPLNQIGWCNENIFFGGRFCNWSHFDWSECESVAILIEGPDRGDTYNSSNSLLFIKPCMDGFKGCAVYAKNVVGCHWQDARTEGTQCFIKFVGSCIDNEANSLYGTNEIDYEECLTYPMKICNIFPIYSTNMSIERILEIDTRAAKVFKVKFVDSQAKARVGVQYLCDEKGKSISNRLQKTMTGPRSASHPDSFYYNEGVAQWKLATDSSECELIIPSNVSKVRVMLTGQFMGATVYSDKAVKIIER